MEIFKKVLESLDGKKVLNFVWDRIKSQALSVVTSKLVEVLEVHVILGKIGFSKATIAIILLLI
jgi:hypothetical protein